MLHTALIIPDVCVMCARVYVHSSLGALGPLQYPMNTKKILLLLLLLLAIQKTQISAQPEFLKHVLLKC